LIYYIYIKKSNGIKLLDQSQLYTNYLKWYNTAKRIIKKKILDDIVYDSDNNLVNIYKYILDTKDKSDTDIVASDIYESFLFNGAEINGNHISECRRHIPNNNINIINRQTINNLFNDIPNKELVLNALWEIYLKRNLDPFIELLNNPHPHSNYMDLIYHLVLFYKNCKLYHKNSTYLHVINYFLIDYKLY
jgi:hypothetical protein